MRSFVVVLTVVAALVLAAALSSAECPFAKNAGAKAGYHHGHYHGGNANQQLLRVGQPAPLFAPAKTLFPNGTIGSLTLEQLRGQWVVIVFYPLAWSFVCVTELIELSLQNSELAALNTVAVTVSVDSVYTQDSWTKAQVKDGGIGKVTYPMISDMRKEISSLYQVLIEQGDDAGIALRGTFVIDPTGKLRHSSVNDLPVGRNVDELVRLVRAFQHADAHGRVCPSRWSADKPATIVPDPMGKLEYFEKLAKEMHP